MGLNKDGVRNGGTPGNLSAANIVRWFQLSVNPAPASRVAAHLFFLQGSGLAKV